MARTISFAGQLASVLVATGCLAPQLAEEPWSYPPGPGESWPGEDRNDAPVAVPSGPTHTAPLDYPIERIVAFAGRPVAPRGPARGPGGKLSIDPPLPAGLYLDTATGLPSGTPARPTAGSVHVLSDGARTTAIWVEVLPPPSPDRSRFVAPTGRDDNPGTLERPFRTVAAAAATLRPGMTLYLRGGVHRGSTELRSLQGAAGAPIVIRSYPGEHAVLDASVALFADAPAKAWQRARGPGTHRDEWISSKAYPAELMDTAGRGAFLDRPHYTRLLTYSRIEDLRADNETFDHIAVGDPRPGPGTIPGARGHRDERRPRRPWIYFGPGIHFDTGTGRIHIRLSPTRNRVPDLEEYSGPSDPRELALAISGRSDRALGLFASRHVRVTDVALRHGGDDTVFIQGSSDVTIDHVDIRASTRGLWLARSKRVRLLHSRIDGGVPPWTFRSDFKARYDFRDPRGQIVENRLVGKTQQALLYMANGNADVEVAYTELVNGHDNYLAGARTDFHHNRIRNLHDEAILLLAGDEDGMRIHHNVIEKSLSGMSFADRKSGARRYIYRNLFDLREPTAGYRPDGAGRPVWRGGHSFKNRGSIGSVYLYQNTILVARHRQKAAFLHLVALERDGIARRPRWFLNNLLMVVSYGFEIDRVVSFVPHPSYLGAKDSSGRPLLRSNGNLWVRTAVNKRPLFRCLPPRGQARCPRKTFSSLDELRGIPEMEGFEAESVEARSAGFRHLGRLEAPSPGDDLRPSATSPARQAGIALPVELPDPDRPPTGRPDIGAFGSDQAPLRVGVDGRHVY